MERLNATPGIFGSISTTNNTNKSSPSVGFFGGIGDKIILFSAASQINHPYSIGINLTSLWNSIPSGNTSIWTCIWIFNCISQFQEIQADSTDSIPTNTIPTRSSRYRQIVLTRYQQIQYLHRWPATELAGQLASPMN